MPGRTRRSRGESSSQPVEDLPMTEAPSTTDEPEAARDSVPMEEEPDIEPQRVRILPGSSDKAASFEFLEEGHTLGNALRWVIMKNPDVEFCAYTIPHPSEAKMNVRIQTYDGLAVDALRKGLNDLAQVCDAIVLEFQDKIDGSRTP